MGPEFPPATFSFFFSLSLSLGGLLVEFWCLKRRDPLCARFEFSGCHVNHQRPLGKNIPRPFVWLRAAKPLALFKSRTRGATRRRLSSFTAKPMSGRRVLKNRAIPTTRRNTLCSSTSSKFPSAFGFPLRTVMIGVGAPEHCLASIGHNQHTVRLNARFCSACLNTHHQSTQL